jgi:O-antigen/teichoic acid export membrane protein
MAAARQSGWHTIAGTLLPFGAGQACAVISLLWLARRLTAEQFGQLSFGLTVQSYLVLIGTLGIKTVILREASARSADHSKLLTSHAVITVSASTFVGLSVAVWLSLSGMPHEERILHYWLLVGAWSSSVNPSSFLDAGGRQPLTQAITGIVEFLFLMALGIGIVPLTLPSIGGAFAAKLLLACVLSAACVPRAYQSSTWKWDLSRTLPLIHAGWPLLITSLMATWPISGTVVMVRFLDGPMGAAIMGFAAQVATAYLLVAGVGYRLLQPRLTSPDDLRHHFPVTLALQLLACLGAIWLMAMAVAWGMTRSWLPAQFRAGSGTTSVMLTAGLLGAAVYAGWAMLLALKRERTVLASYLVGNVIFMATIVPAIRCGGHWGAAWSSVAAMMATLFVMTAAIRSSLRAAADTRATARFATD